MICPKCEEGRLIKIKFKNTGRIGFLCEFCQTFWFENENIHFKTGHSLEAYLQGTEKEYVIEELSDQNY